MRSIFLRGAQQKAYMSAALALLGSTAFGLNACMFKKSLATQESVMTGSGAQTRFLVPVPVEEDDGATGYCVYVAGPDADLSALAPGQTQGAYVLTAQSITQDDFFTGLENLKGVGGWGNSIVADVIASSSAGVLTAGLAYSGTELILSSKLSEGVRQQFDARLASLSGVGGKARVADLVLDGKAVTASRFIRRLLIQSGMSLDDASQVQSALLNAPAQTVSRAQTGIEFAKGALMQSQLTIQARAQALARLTEGVPSGAVRSGANLSDLTNDIFRARQSQVEIASGTIKIQEILTKLTAAARKSDAEVLSVLNSGADNAVVKNLDDLVGRSPLVAREGIENLTAAVAGKSAVFTKSVVAASDRPVASAGVRQVVSKKIDDLGAGLVKGARGVRNVCVGPGGDWKLKAGRLMLCGLAAGTTTWGLKKMAWEPATAGAKLSQVTDAMGDAEMYQKVNARTFEAIATGIGGFETSSFGKACE